MKSVCVNCGYERKGDEIRCPECGHLFEMKPDFKYRDNIYDNFPYVKEWIDLGENTTPVIKLDNFSLKLDYMLPTFSYKDRGSRNMLSYMKGIAKKYGIREICEDSSGNAGASIAAYGRAAGFDVSVYVPETVSGKKMEQIESYGAKVLKIPGSRESVQKAAENSGKFYASHVFRPEFRDGIRTLAYEIYRQFPEMPENIYVPVSAGTLLSGLYSGMKHLFDSGEISSMPSLIAVQAKAISPLCSVINGEKYNPENNDTTIADALVSKKPDLLGRMDQIIREGGKCISVSDDEIISARKDLSLRGVFCEYSSATVYAAYKKKKYENSLLVITGNGLKN